MFILRWYVRRGRIRRRTYWLQYEVPFYAATTWTVVEHRQAVPNDPGPDLGYVLLAVLLALPPLVSSHVARLHDCGVDTADALWSGGSIRGWGHTLMAAFEEGIPGENEYGPDPKEDARPFTLRRRTRSEAQGG